MNNAPEQVVACKGIIVRDNKVLLMRESAQHSSNSKTGLYQFPGGRIDPGEPFAEGFAREIYEETGLRAEITAPFDVNEWFPTVHGKSLHIVAIFFTCHEHGGEIIISDEHDAFAWVDASSIETLPIMQPDLEILQAYLAAR